VELACGVEGDFLTHLLLSLIMAEECTPLPGDSESAPAEVVAGVDEQRGLGNGHFKEGSYEDALVHYAEAMRLLDEASGAGVVLGDLSVRSAIASNQALCFLKLERFQDAETAASVSLAADLSNSKASYRRGLARLHLSDAVGALEDLQRALRLEPNSREIRQRVEEAQNMVNAAQPAKEEVSLATGATGALGREAGGGLYSEKPDLNEGRLAETHLEQREWIQTIDSWSDICDIAFADEGDKGHVSVYMTLPGVHEITQNKICVWMQPNSLEVRVIDCKGTNWCYIAQELFGQIDPEKSTWKVRRNKLSIKLHKRPSARNWDKWEKLRRI